VLVRKCVPGLLIEGWYASKSALQAVQVSSDAIVERPGSLQVDFANEYMGGNVLIGGAAQEEILFATRPEALVAILLVEKLRADEAVVMVGLQTFAAHSGYSPTFRCEGPGTPLPADAEMAGCHVADTQLVAMDALEVYRYIDSLEHSAAKPLGPEVQYSMPALLRELNKAHAGFCAMPAPGFEILADRRDIDSGNWGCGASGGDAQLKFLLQWAVASQTGREMCFHAMQEASPGRPLEQADDVVEMVRSKISTVGGLLQLLSEYEHKGLPQGSAVFDFVRCELEDKAPFAVST